LVIFNHIIQIKQPDEIDLVISRNLKKIRHIRRLNLSDVAPYVGVTYQQLQKYESGKNRISAGRLYKLSKFYEIQIQDFFKKY
jgi:transcriptional regulator with XRE-family HTH domain